MATTTKVNWFWRMVGAIVWRVWWLEEHFKFRVQWSATFGYIAGAAVLARWFV